MKIKVATASGPVLDWMVATVENIGCLPPRMYGWKIVPTDDSADFYSPSTDWSQGGPILTREHINRTIGHSGLWVAYWADDYADGDEGKKWMQCNRSELVAGLRCYVASKLGEEVEVPDELTNPI